MEYTSNDFEKFLRGEENAIDEEDQIDLTKTSGDNYDPFALIKRAIDSDFDSSVFERIDDSDLPLAYNWLDFCVNSRYLNIKPFPTQIKFGLQFFADYCPDCSDPGVVDNLFDESLQEILDRVQTLHHGVCPKCKRTRLDFAKEGKLHYYNELAGCAGQRAGKCLAYDTIILTEDGVMQIGEYCKKSFSVGFNEINLNIHNGNKLTPAKYFYKTDKSPVYRVELKSGAFIKGKDSHPIKTFYGFQLLKDLKKGTPIKVDYGQNVWGNKIPIFDTKTIRVEGDLTTKEIPLLIRQAPKIFVTEFLKSLFEGDGGMEANKVVSYCTISEKLITQLSGILLNLGIPHKLIRGYALATNGTEKQVPRRYYSIYIGGKYLEVFQKEIGFISKRKKKALEKAVETHRNRQKKNPLYYDKLPDVIKVEFLKLISEIKKELHVYWSGSTDRYGFLTLVNYSKVFGVLNRDNVCLTKQKIQFLVNCVEASKYKKRLSNSTHQKLRYFESFCEENSYWTYVKNIEKLEEEELYDFNIPDKHQFWTNGIISHNSVWVSMTACYQLHRFLKIPNPSHYFSVLKNQTLHMTFVAISYVQAQDTLWQPFRDFYDDSPWFKNYNAMLDSYGAQFGVPLYSKKDTFLWYDHKRLTCYASGPDKRKLRGRTRFFCSVDELGWFHGTDKAMKLNPDEVCKALERSLRTVRSASEKRREILNESHTPDGLFVNISSPSAANDKIMRLIRDTSIPGRYFFHLPTWEMNPNITRKSLDAEYKDDPVAAERDYGANPPLSDSPFISNPELVHTLIQNIYKNQCKYTVQAQVDKAGYTTLRVAKLKLGEFDPSINYVLGVDTGHTKNAFALVLQHYDSTQKTAIIDLMIEVRPIEEASVHFPSIFEKVMLPVIAAANIALVVFDTWNTINYEQELHNIGIDSLRYSLKIGDFSTIRGLILSKKIIIPKPEIKFEEIVDPSQDYNQLIARKPVSHFIYQILTVRDRGNSITKGLGVDDDIFRAWCLGAKFLYDLKWEKIFQSPSGGKKKKKSLGTVFQKASGAFLSAGGAMVKTHAGGPLGTVRKKTKL